MAQTYDIVSQVPKKRSTPGGVFEDVVQVVFTAKPSGQTGIVDVPATVFSADEVDKLVSAAAATMNAVQAL